MLSRRLLDLSSTERTDLCLFCRPVEATTLAYHAHDYCVEDEFLHGCAMVFITPRRVDIFKTIKINNGVPQGSVSCHNKALFKITVWAWWSRY